MESMFRHLRFVRDHHQKVERVALCAGGRMARLAPALAKHFVRAKIEQFPYEDLERAVTWAAGGG
jgi:hypothetical protein